VYSKIIYPGAWRISPKEGRGGGFVACFRGKHGTEERLFSIRAFPCHQPAFDPQHSDRMTHQVNQIYEFNTFYGTTGRRLSATILWRTEFFPDDPRHIFFRNNIVYHNNLAYTPELSIVSFGTYMSDELYTLLVPELMLNKNCYYDANIPVQFGFAAGLNGEEGFALGGI
jgi:hypothetical protein